MNVEKLLSLSSKSKLLVLSNKNSLKLYLLLLDNGKVKFASLEFLWYPII